MKNFNSDYSNLPFTGGAIGYMSYDLGGMYEGSNKKSDLKELREFHETAKTFVRERYKGKRFRIGYHAIPSMRPLHLHIISCDFQSDRRGHPILRRRDSSDR